MATSEGYKNALTWTLVILFFVGCGFSLYLLRQFPLLLIIGMLATFPLSFLIDGRGISVSSIVSGLLFLAFLMVLVIWSSHGKFEAVLQNNLLSGHVKQKRILVDNDEGCEYKDTAYYFVADTKTGETAAPASTASLFITSPF